MSYSYVKTVFPDFTFSNVYNDKLYTDVNVKTEPLNVVGFNNEIESNQLINQPVESTNNTQVFNKPIIDQHIPSYNNIDPKRSSYFDQPQKAIYEPIPFVRPHNDLRNLHTQEEFGNTDTIETSITHENYIKHITNCPSCKQVLLKQFNIETERIKNDEIMELISYIIFGIFLFILLDSLKR